MASYPSELAHRIRCFIEDKNMQPGMRLPSERELSEQLAASRGSVREALRELEAMGVVEKQPRSGTYLRDVNMMNALAQTRHQVDSESIRQIFEMRTLLEPGCASLAATRATDADCAALRGVLATMREYMQAGDVVAFMQADAEFHQVLTETTHNRHLIHLVGEVMNVLEESLQVSLHVPGQMERAIAGHQQILTAIENRQPGWAAAAMETHLRDAWHYISIQKEN